MGADASSTGDTPGLDAGAVARWLGGLDLGATPPLTFRRIGGGNSNLMYSVDDAGGRRWILRRPPLGQLLASAHDVEREHGILRRLEATDVPAPRALAVSTETAVCEVPLVLMEHVPGIVIDSDAVARGLSEEHRRGSGQSLARTLAKVHGVDLDATGLTDLASHAPYAPRQLKRWRRQWEQSKTRELPVVDALPARLERSAPKQQEVTLVHGDYHLLNTIVDPGDGAVRAVLDWELSTLGDPLADLGGLLAYWSQEDDPVAAGPFTFTALPGFPTRRELTEAYAEAAGRDIGALPFWEALAGWKIAIIIEGVRRRALDEPRLGEPLDGAIVTGLLDRAVEVTDAAGY